MHMLTHNINSNSNKHKWTTRQFIFKFPQIKGIKGKAQKYAKKHIKRQKKEREVEEKKNEFSSDHLGNFYFFEIAFLSLKGVEEMSTKVFLLLSFFFQYSISSFLFYFIFSSSFWIYRIVCGLKIEGDFDDIIIRVPKKKSPTRMKEE